MITTVNSTSNVGVPGVWVFRIDGEEIEPACTDKGTIILCTCVLNGNYWAWGKFSKLI